MDEYTVGTRYWHPLEDGRVQCDVCPRACKLREGQRGLCFVRSRQDNAIVLTSYGRSSGFCVDPVEKKPLNHFLPGSSILSFGTAGCNLACRFCQNWDMSKSKEIDTLADAASPETIAQAARELGCASVAFTYNDPVIFFLEYATDVADACHDLGLKAVAVTAGYVCPEPRAELFRHLDAANVDLKGFTEDFYRHVCGGELHAVLDTLEYLHATDVWFELTTLLIPGLNDSDAELDAMTGWVVEHLGSDVPMHFSAFHPDFRMLDRPPTPPETLTRARRIALANGVRHAYTGNVHDPDGQSTYCPGRATRVITRDWYQLGEYRLDEHGHCQACGTRLPGVFAASARTWGPVRQPVVLGRVTGTSRTDVRPR